LRTEKVDEGVEREEDEIDLFGVMNVIGVCVIPPIRDFEIECEIEDVVV